MKVISQDEANAHYNYVLLHGAEGAAIGLAVGLGGIYLAGRRWPSFRQMPLSFKAFLLSAGAAGTSVTFADRASLRFERKRYSDRAIDEQVVLPADSDWKHRAALWASNNRWKLIAGAWVGSLAGSWQLINRNKFMTQAQKVVQARMIAQGLILLLVSAALASRGDDDKIEIVDPEDPTKTLLVQEKYPGESTWLSQLAAEEDRLRAEGKIDKQGHLKSNGKNGDKAKKAEEK